MEKVPYSLRQTSGELDVRMEFEHGECLHPADKVIEEPAGAANPNECPHFAPNWVSAK